jgi:multicomponent Na+:H+ antiporter subunit E
MTAPSRIAFLALIWVLLWGRLSVANVLSGVVVASLLLLLYPPARGPRQRIVFRPLALLRLLGYVVGSVLVADLQIIRQILSRRAHESGGIILYEFENPASGLVTFVATVLALSPGTMPVRVTVAPATIGVHVLRVSELDATRRQIRHLEQLSARAFTPRGSTHGVP